MPTVRRLLYLAHAALSQHAQHSLTSFWPEFCTLVLKFLNQHYVATGGRAHELSLHIPDDISEVEIYVHGWSFDIQIIF